MTRKKLRTIYFLLSLYIFFMISSWHQVQAQTFSEKVSIDSQFVSHLHQAENSDNTSQYFPLSTKGRYLIDAKGHRFKLKSVNWYGANLERQVVDGLNHQPIDHIIGLIKDWGFNSVRLPFSNEMLHDKTIVDDALIQANRQFSGLTALEIFDRIIQSLTEAGLAVILNNHSTLSEWCCGFDYNGLWYHTGSRLAYNQTLEMWENDWLMLIKRYQHNPLVIGADLRNEVRTMRLSDTHLPVSPNWGRQDRNDWHMASQNLGNRLLHLNPNLLVIVEGINWWGLIPILGSGERPHLRPIRDKPVRLSLPNNLLYAAHNYSYTGPKHNGDDRTSNGNIKYRDMDQSLFFQTLHEEWGYVTQAEQYYTAPVWLSEFGASRSTEDENDRRWFRYLVQYMIENDLDFAYWPLNHEDYGLVSHDWSQNLKDDWRYESLKQLLQFEGQSGQVQESRYTSLAIQKNNDFQSSSAHDWLVGAHKGQCPDSFRLVGISQNHKALCTDKNQSPLSPAEPVFHVEAVNETATRYHGTGDWATGFTKYECPTDYYAVGFSKHHWGTSGLLCLHSQKLLTNHCQTLWFDRQDQRYSLTGGDWAVGSYKGQCRDDQYLAGIAQRDGQASAILCCDLE